jgi:hypothetical protein
VWVIIRWLTIYLNYIIFRHNSRFIDGDNERKNYICVNVDRRYIPA